MIVKPLILVVHSDHVFCKSIRTGLEARGYGVILAGDEREALNRMFDTSPDLLLLDISSSFSESYPVLHAIRKCSEIPAILLCNRLSNFDQWKSIDLKIDDFIILPNSIEMLVSRIRAVLSKTGKDKAGKVQQVEMSGSRAA